METQDTHIFEVAIMPLDPNEPEPTTEEIEETLRDGGLHDYAFDLTVTKVEPKSLTVLTPGSYTSIFGRHFKVEEVYESGNVRVWLADGSGDQILTPEQLAGWGYRVEAPL